MSKNYFSRIFSYAWLYKKYFILNIISNIFYAFFGTMSMISLFPMLKVLFDQTEALTTPPAWRGGLDIVKFAEDYLNFFVTTKKLEGNNDVLIFMVGLIVITLSLILVPLYGGLGAAISVAIAIAMQNLLAVHWVKKRLGINMLMAWARRGR